MVSMCHAISFLAMGKAWQAHLWRAIVGEYGFYASY
jgi:hypothetical protein